MALEVTSGRPAQREALVALLLAQLREHDILIDRAGLAHAVEGVFEQPSRGLFLLARLDGRDVGVAYLSFQWALEHGGKSCWLEELYVVPELRGKGIGRALLEEAIARARAVGCAAIDLEVEDEHQRAEHLYERRGFRPHRRRRWVLQLGERHG